MPMNNQGPEIPGMPLNGTPPDRVTVSRQRLKRTKRILEGAAVASQNLVGLAESANIAIRSLCEELVWYHGLFEKLNEQAAKAEEGGD